MGKHLPTSILAAYLVLRHEGKVLFAQRQNTGYCDGQWGLPAGHVEAGETFTQALSREMKEELGIVLSTNDLHFLHANHRKAEDRSERVNAFFEANVWSGEIKNMEPEKCAELGWFSLDAMPENTIPYVRETLEYIGRGIHYREEGW